MSDTVTRLPVVCAVPVVGADGGSHRVVDEQAAAAAVGHTAMPALCGQQVVPCPWSRPWFTCGQCASAAAREGLPAQCVA